MLLEPEVRDDPAAERAGLAERLGWQVNDQDLFAQALAHRSWCAEHPRHEPNERLEFLGDAVLGQIVTDYLYRSYPDLPEGELAKARAAVVNSASLAGTARELRVGNALLLGKGEDSSGGRLKPSILADAMEALIGAIYLDAGYAVTDAIVLRLLEERLREAAKGPGDDDYKTRLQELCAQTFDELPVYRVTDSGPDHAKVFEAQVIVGGRSRGIGDGRSKKQAEQMAAKHAWYTIKADQAAQAADLAQAADVAQRPTPRQPRQTACRSHQGSSAQALTARPAASHARATRGRNRSRRRREQVRGPQAGTHHRHGSPDSPQAPARTAQGARGARPVERGAPREVPAVQLGRRPGDDRPPPHERPNARREARGPAGPAHPRRAVFQGSGRAALRRPAHLRRVLPGWPRRAGPHRPGRARHRRGPAPGGVRGPPGEGQVASRRPNGPGRDRQHICRRNPLRGARCAPTGPAGP